MVRVELTGVHLPTPPWRSPVQLAEKLVFERGGCNVVLGEADSGKTALLDVVVGLRAPLRGRVHFDGCDVTRHSPNQRNVARVGGAGAVYEALSAADNLALPLRARGLREPEVSKRIAPVFEALDLGGCGERLAGRLTLAQRQRVALGRALVRSEAAVIALDAPLAPFSAEERAPLRATLVALLRDVRATVLWATAEADEAMSLGGHCVVLNRGRMLQQGSAEQLARAPRTTALGAWLHDPPLNLLPCVPRGEFALVGAHRLRVQGIARFTATPLPRLELGVRAQDLRIGVRADERALDLRLAAIERLGTQRYATFTDDHAVTLRAGPVDGMLAVGQRYWIELPAEHVRLYADGEAVDA